MDDTDMGLVRESRPEVVLDGVPEWAGVDGFGCCWAGEWEAGAGGLAA